MEKMFTVEDDDVGGFAAILALNQNISMAKTTICFGANVNGFLLLFHKLLVQVKVIGL